MTSGVYKIVGPKGKTYVGQSVNMTARWREHKRRLGKQIHHCKPLQAAWNKYGWSAFRFEIILETDCLEDLTAGEQAALDALAGHCYNTAPVAASMRGYKHTDAAKAKMKGRAGVWSGKTLPDEMRKKIGVTRRLRGILPPNKGVAMSQAQREQMEGSVWSKRRGGPTFNKGGKPTHNAGKHLSAEQKAKMSATRIERGLGGQPPGWRHSEATRAKMRASAAKRWHGEVTQ